MPMYVGNASANTGSGMLAMPNNAVEDPALVKIVRVGPRTTARYPPNMHNMHVRTRARVLDSCQYCI